MRIEILVDQEDPYIFPLNKPKVVVGSQETCDVFLQNSGVSRKHLLIVNEDDHYYVIDQGSTNGTYINEERLVPGRKVEFTSFFPVRLGDNVLIMLLSDEEGDERVLTKHHESTSSGTDEVTRSISLKDLQAVKTEKLVQKRQEAVFRRKATLKSDPLGKNKDKIRMFWVKLFCLAIVGSAAYYNFYLKDPMVTELARPVQKIGQVIKTAPIAAPRFSVVDPSDFTPKERFKFLLQGLSCSSDIEKYLCEKFPTSRANVIQSGSMVHLFLNGGDYYQQAKKLLPNFLRSDSEVITPREKQKYEDDLKLTTLLLFLRDMTPKDLNYEMLKGMNLTFAINLTLDNDTKEYVPLVIVPETLEKLIKVMEPQHFGLAKKYGADSLYFLKDYFRVY